MARTGPGSERPLGSNPPVDPDEIIVGPLDPEGTPPPAEELRALTPRTLIRSEGDNDG